MSYRGRSGDEEQRKHVRIGDKTLRFSFQRTVQVILSEAVQMLRSPTICRTIAYWPAVIETFSVSILPRSTS